MTEVLLDSILNKAIDWFQARDQEFYRWSQLQLKMNPALSEWELVSGFLLKENEPVDPVHLMTMQHEAIHKMLKYHPRAKEICNDPALRQEVIGDWITKHGKENREAEIMHQLFLLEQRFEEFKKRFPITQQEA